jgi:ankyrin repeat protein
MNTSNTSELEKAKAYTETLLKNSLLLIKHCQHGDFDQAKQVLSEHFINLDLQDDKGYTAFHYTCIHEDLEMLDLLLAKYVVPTLPEDYINHELEHFVEVQDKQEHKTILHYVCEKGLLEFYDKLLMHFPHSVYKVINYSTDKGYTALHYACENAHHQLLEKLLNLDILEINKPNKQGNTALHLACLHNHLPLVKQLLLHPQLNINTKNLAGDTPLHIAAKLNHYGSILIVKELLNMRSIIPQLKNNRHETPLDLAKDYNHLEIEALLLKQA